MIETITIERMGYGAEAVGHLSDGKTVFVEGGAPGDVASVEVVENKSTFSSRPYRQLPSSPGACRVMPKWVEPAASGAAPWQHIAYDAQLEAKRANVVAAFARTGGFGDAAAELVAPCLPSKRQWGGTATSWNWARNGMRRARSTWAFIGGAALMCCRRCPARWP